MIRGHPIPRLIPCLVLSLKADHTHPAQRERDGKAIKHVVCTAEQAVAYDLVVWTCPAFTDGWFLWLMVS